MGRMELLVVAALALALLGIAWLLRTGLWKRGRLALLGIALLAGFLLLTHRVGWGELLILVAVLGVPILLLAPRRPPRPGR
jgi:hypothetical protein